MGKFKVSIFIIIIVLAFRIRFVLDGHLVPIAQLVARFIFSLSTCLCLTGSYPASYPFTVVSMNIFYFWGFFHYRTVLLSLI